MPGKILMLGVSSTLMLALGASAIAQGRPDTRTMSCGQVQEMIERNGAMVLTTGQHTYDRYVSRQTYCPWPDVPRAASVVTTDTDRCLIFNCRTRIDTFDD